MRSIVFAVVGIFSLISLCMADSTTTNTWNLKQHGFLGLEGGEIVHGIEDANHVTNGTEIEKSWQERLLFNYANDLTLNERLHMYMTIECQMSFSYPYDQIILFETHQPAFSFYPDRAEAVYSLGDVESPYLQIGFGYFPFKTNPDAKNLGDYLFRTNTYPVYVINTFNRPYSRLLGFDFSSTLFNDLHQHLLLTSSNLFPPLVDFSLSYTVNYSLFNKVLDLGAGISLAHLFPIDNSITTPSKDKLSYVDLNNDTLPYTFAGTKPMVRFAIDPKPLIPLDWFGKNDLRLYGEICVTAWQNYEDTTKGGVQNFYANRADRTLYMLGFNFPTFNVLDVLSAELEWFPGKYPNSSFYFFGQGTAPQPKPPLTSSSREAVYPLFWSFYAKKTIVDKVSLIVQLARDHMRPINNNVQYPYYEDVLERKGDWWWAFRLNVSY